MFNFHKNHRLFVLTVFLGYLFLSVIIAVQPADSIQKNNATLPNAEPMSDEAKEGLKIFVAEGCVGCHTQQVRNIDMDKMWGGRPGIAADYAWRERIDVWRATPSVLGTERTGPDLTEVGERQPSEDWHYLHLFNPRSVVKESIMPSYQWLFDEKSKVDDDEKVLNIPTEYRDGRMGKIVPNQRAKALIAYLLSLKQTDLPTGNEPKFIQYRKEKEVVAGNKTEELDGAKLYANTCQACHQANGEGLKGAFPSLKGSPIVNDKNAEMIVSIILKGYNAREEYAVMPAFENKLSDAEIAAIATHERSSWGNKAEKVSPEFVKEIRAKIKTVQ
jgi:cytochrome c oxidase cbb3-type subunit II